MKVDQAKRVILRHADPGPTESPATLLESLRPYRGLQENHFLQLLEALVAVAPQLSEEPEVDREIVHALWDICFTARAWTRGPHEPMFHGKRWISAEEKQVLDEWIYIIESCTLHLLRGDSVHHVFAGLAWHVRKNIWGDRAAFLALLFVDGLTELFESDYLSSCSDYDDYLHLCESLASMRSVAKQIMPLLEKLPVQTAPMAIQVAVRQAIDQLSR